MIKSAVALALLFVALVLGFVLGQVTDASAAPTSEPRISHVQVDGRTVTCAEFGPASAPAVSCDWSGSR